MNKYICNIKNRDGINIWKYDKFSISEYISEPTVFVDKDHYCNIGLTATNMEQIAEIIYPVREKFLEENMLDKVDYVKKEYNNLYFPWENSRVEFSGFNHYPAVRSLNFQSFVEVEEDCSYKFSLKFTGGIKIWVNGKLQVQIGGYKRNCGVKKYITLNFQKGENEIVVHTNDLAERDIFYYFEMKYLGDSVLKSYIYLDEPKSLDLKSTALRTMYFISDEVTMEDCKLGFDKEIIEEGFEFFIKADGVNNIKKYKISKSDLDLGYININGYFDENTLGGRKVKVICELSDCKIERELYVLIYSKENEKLSPKGTITERKAQAIDYLYKHKSDVVPRLIPTLEKGKRLNEEERNFLFTTLKFIDDRLDCSDFRLPVILLIKERYGELLDEDVLDEIKRVTLNFRYWLDEMGSDVMWFFSENHAFLFHVAQYISGYIYKDETFVSGHNSKKQYQLGKERLIKWYKEFLAVGYDEWNSTTYLPVDFIGFFVLYEMSQDKEILEYTKKALDISFEIIASNVHRNTYATSYGRTYEKQLKSAKLAELSMISWIAYGYGSPNNRDQATALFAMSGYVPKDYTNLLDTDEKSITIERLQGRNKVYTYIHKRREYAMASAVRYKPFSDGLQQHVFNLTLGDENKNVISWINHPGERLFSGDHRPSYWAGNGVIPLIDQHKNLCLISYKIDDEKDIHYVHAYMPINELSDYVEEGKWFFGRVNSSFVGIYFENFYEITKKGANTNKEIISHGLENYIVVKSGSEMEHGSFKTFIEKCKNSTLKINDVENFVYNDFEYGKVEVIKDKNLIVNGKELLREAKKEGIISYN